MAMIRRSKDRPREPQERVLVRDLQGLTAGLGSPDPAIRRWSARDLGQHPEGSAALAARLPLERDPACRDALLASLASIGDPVAVAGLAGCLRSEDAALRNEAIEALKRLPGPAAPAIQDLLADADPDVRILAVSVLEAFRHPDVASWLVRVIEQDPEVNVCAAAVDLLAEVGTKAALPALARLPERFPDQPFIRFAADLACKRLEDC
jgi:HEAT repeat protein